MTANDAWGGGLRWWGGGLQVQSKPNTTLVPRLWVVVPTEKLGTNSNSQSHTASHVVTVVAVGPAGNLVWGKREDLRNAMGRPLGLRVLIAVRGINP